MRKTGTVWGNARCDVSRGWRAAPLVALSALIVACSSSTTGPPTPPPPPPPPPASSIVVSGGDEQVAAPGEAVATAPEVRVTNSQGQGVPGVSVTFAVISGGGSVANPTTATNSQGRASAGTWTLGNEAGTQELRATVSGVGSVTFTATAQPPATPASIQVVSGDGQSATVGTAVAAPLTVRVLDDASNPIAGVPVTFAVVAGGGVVTGAVVATDAAGEASPAGWTLGTVAGTNRLRASVSGLSPQTFSATGTPGPAATVTLAAGDGQSATVSTAVAIAPTVLIEDVHGNAVSGVAVSFAVTSGGGNATGTSPTTDAHGRAAVGNWTLGPTPGTNTLEATVSGVIGSPVTFTATGQAGGGAGAFDIEIRFNPGSTPTAAQQAAYDAAEARWEQIITGDLPDTPVNRPAGTCTSATPISETIDDLVIFVTLEVIDGPGGVLGSAGPCLIRSGSNLPIAGSMRFDTADLSTLESNGLLDEVILHEMGHVLGVGTLWPLLGLLADPAGSGGVDPHFTGADATSAFSAVGGAGYSGNVVPVEDGGGSGTQDGHWRESVFDTELMTGWIDFGSNQLSLVTVESLDDMGYAIDPSQADAYSLPVSPSIVPRSGGEPAIQLRDDILRDPIEVVDATGRRVGLIVR